MCGLIAFDYGLNNDQNGEKFIIFQYLLAKKFLDFFSLCIESMLLAQLENVSFSFFIP